MFNILFEFVGPAWGVIMMLLGMGGILGAAIAADHLTDKAGAALALACGLAASIGFASLNYDYQKQKAAVEQAVK